MFRNHNEKLETYNRFISVPNMTAMTPTTTYLHTEQNRETLRFHVLTCWELMWGCRLQAPGLNLMSAIVVASAQVEVGDGRDWLQGSGNDLTKTKHEQSSLELFWTKRCQYENQNRQWPWAKSLCFRISPPEEWYQHRLLDPKHC